jgi:hypothetical protein
MKKILIFLFFILPLFTYAQFTTNNPDTVCFPIIGNSTYLVPNTVGYNYTWNVLAPGIITSGQGTNQITVNWNGAQPGLINNAITVFATTGNNCQSTPINLNVLIYQVIPTITQIGPFCAGDPCVNLVGNPVNGIFSGLGVQNGQFCPTISGAGNPQITYTYVSGGCTFTTTIDVIVNAIPVLSPIQHD